MSAIPWQPEKGHTLLMVTSRDDDEGTIGFNEPGFTTVRLCRHCGVLIAGGPTACVHCVRERERRPWWVRLWRAARRSPKGGQP